MFETRKIKIKELNDSRMVIFSVYTIVVAGIAVAPVIALLSDRVTVKYAIIGIICLASATLLLGMNFIPKVCCAIFWLLVLCSMVPQLYVSLHVGLHTSVDFQILHLLLSGLDVLLVQKTKW